MDRMVIEVHDVEDDDMFMNMLKKQPYFVVMDGEEAAICTVVGNQIVEIATDDTRH